MLIQGTKSSKVPESLHKSL